MLNPIEKFKRSILHLNRFLHHCLVPHLYIHCTFSTASISLRPPRGVCEAHLHQAYKPCVIGAIPSMGM